MSFKFEHKNINLNCLNDLYLYFSPKLLKGAKAPVKLTVLSLDFIDFQDPNGSQSQKSEAVSKLQPIWATSYEKIEKNFRTA